MKNIVSNNNVDLIVDLLRRAKVTGTRAEVKDDIECEITEYNHNPRTFIRGSDMDGTLMLSIKNRDINQRKKEEYFQAIKKFMEDIINRMTDKDYKMLLEMGFKAEDLSVESLAGAIQFLKDYNIIQYYCDESVEKNDENILDDKIIARMEHLNLPVTEESKERVKEALNLSEIVPSMEKKDILYLLNNSLPLTIKNLYMARYSRQNYKSEGQLSDADWEELIPQVKGILNNSGIPSDPDVLSDARWLIENDLPITEKNLKTLKEFDELTKNYDKEDVLNKILYGMQEGTYPEDVVLAEEDESEDYGINYNENYSDPVRQAQRIMEDIHKDYEKEIINPVRNGMEITLRNLKDLCAEDACKDSLSHTLTEEEMAKVIAAKRQLEEIRLKMTAEAALRLEKKGFSIDTRPLKEVVEKLRSEEENYYRQLYEINGITPDEEQVETLKAATQSIHELSNMPSYILGTTLYDREKQTISALLDVGRNMVSALEKAKEAYEPLLTQPRPEYGDSIQKAFDNMDSLIDEIGIEDTIYNRRAIRILGYNHMEITKESIEQVKAYDMKVNYLLMNLNPGIAVKIIKEGINPLNMPIDELNAMIEKLDREGYSSLEKYSTYLYRLEKKSEITESEKKAYIGIYRLLYRIEKSDGAALGALIKSGREVTLSHLLTALRTGRKGAMDYKIDEDFGLLEDLSSEKDNITDQLEAVFNNSSVSEEIQKSIIKQLINSITPDKIYQLHQMVKEDSPFLNDSEVWDTIGNWSIEKLLDQVNSMKDSTGENSEYYYENLKEMQNIYNNCDQAIRFLKDFQLPCTTNNLLMAEYVLGNNITLFKNLKKQLKKTGNLTDTLTDRKTMNEAYEELEKEVNRIIEEESKREDINSFKLNQLKSLGLQMQFIRALAKREFYHIPVDVAGKITNINLTIIRGTDEESKVTVTCMSERLGGIKAEIFYNDKNLNGYFVCDNADGLKKIQSRAGTLVSALNNENLNLKHLNFCLLKAPEAYHGFNRERNFSDRGDPETERILYRVAKGILYMIKSAEEDDIFRHREVALK